MKNCWNKIIVIFAFGLLNGCNSEKPQKDLVETAEETNKDIRKNDISGQAEATHKVASDFMVNAASSSLMEIALGKLAQQESKNNEVKNLGKQMENDHGKAYSALQSLGESKNIVIPANPDNEHQKHINQLAELGGSDFDKKYVSGIIDKHDKSIKLFTDASQNNKLDADVKLFAEKTLTTLRQHQEMAKKTQSLLK